jgi:hypothetical protein
MVRGDAEVGKRGGREAESSKLQAKLAADTHRRAQMKKTGLRIEI